MNERYFHLEVHSALQNIIRARFGDVWKAGKEKDVPVASFAPIPCFISLDYLFLENRTDKDHIRCPLLSFQTFIASFLHVLVLIDVLSLIVHVGLYCTSVFV